MGEHAQVQISTQSGSQLHHHDKTAAAAVAATSQLQALPPLQSITTSESDTSGNPPPATKIPFRPQKIRKLSSDAPPDAFDGRSLQLVDETASKSLRACKDAGKHRKRNASQSARVLPRFMKPLSCEGEIDQALRHLRNSDALLAALIDVHLPPKFDSFQAPFVALTKSIIYQQLACKAGSAIYTRFVALCGGEAGVVPGTVLALSSNQLRQIGISGRKASYLYDLANKYKNGILSDSSIIEMDDKSLFTMLTMVKGIGSWSVHMFMIFALHRPDVLPVNDLGVRKGVQFLYGLEELPRPSQMEQLCEKWQPYRSVGSWYMWRFVDLKGNPAAAATLTMVDNTTQQQQQQQQHQLQLLDPIKGIANFGACIWGQ